MSVTNTSAIELARVGLDKSRGFKLLQTLLNLTGVLYLVTRLLSYYEASIRYVVSMFYYLVYLVIPYGKIPPGDSSDPPLVLLTGFLGFSPDRLFGLKYFNFDLNRTTRRVCIPQLTIIGDNTKRAEQAIRQILQEYPGCFDDGKQIDIIGHSQGTLCGDEMIAILNSKYGNPVRTYIRVSGISKALDISTEVLEILEESEGHGIFTWAGGRKSWYLGFISYLTMGFNVVNYLIPYTRTLYDLKLPYNTTARNILNLGFSGFIPTDVTNNLTYSHKIRTINVVTTTENYPWYLRDAQTGIVSLIYALIEAYILGSFSTSHHDGIVDVDDQKIVTAYKISSIPESNRIEFGDIGELEVASTHLSVFLFPLPDQFKKQRILGVAFDLLRVMNH